MTLATSRQVFSIGLQNTFVYRWNFLLRTIFGIVPLIGTIFLWRAVTTSSGGQIAGYEFSTMIFYFMIVVFLDNLISPTEDDWQIAGDIRDGRLSALLLKPLNYIGYRFTLYVSYRLTYVAIVALPIGVLLFFLRDFVQWPQQPATWPLFALSTLMAAGIQFFIGVCLGLCAFWVLEVSTLIFVMFSFEYFLSGMIYPLDMLPASLQGFVKWSPFTYEMFFPVQIMMERVHGAALWQGLAIQAGWLLVAFVATQLIWRAGLRKYQAVGG
ncbi:MAG: ABC-2 family transporter protein [Chthoniobacteraceae bacterium]